MRRSGPGGGAERVGVLAQGQTPKVHNPGPDPTLSGSGVGRGHLAGKATVVGLKARGRHVLRTRAVTICLEFNLSPNGNLCSR